MRSERIGLINALLLGATIAACGCSSSNSGSGGAGASSGNAGSSTAGSSGTGGASGSGTSGSAGVAGASGSGGSAATSGVTSLSGTTAITDLTPAQGTTLCSDTYAYFGGAISKAAACKWKGASQAASSSAPTDAMLQQNCMNQESACQAGGDPWASMSGCSDLPTTACTATVAQYSACIADEVAAFLQLLNGLPDCSALTMMNTGPIFDAIYGATPIASCTALSTGCSSIYPPSPFN